MNHNTAEGWQLIELPQLLSFIVDNRGKSVPTCDKGIVLIATNCIKNTSLYPVFQKVRYLSKETYDTWFRAHPLPGDIIFVNKGTPGRVCLVPDPVNFCIAQDMMAFRVDDKKIYNKYLFAVLRSDYMQKTIENSHVGTLIPHFKKSHLNQLLIPVPDRETQEKIGDFYFSLSNKIEINIRINKVLEEIARALFHRWFVEFEFPDAEGRPYKSSGGKMVESEMGFVPEGWDVGTLEDIAKITMGQSPSGKSYNEEGMGEVFYQGRAEFGARFPTRRLFTTEPKRMAEKGDVLISVRAPVGDLNVASEKCCIGRGLAAIQSKNDRSSFILYAILKLQRELDVFNGEGTVFGSINKGSLNAMPILIPSKHLMDEFEEKVSIIDMQIEINYFENEHLGTLRDTLLPKLMSGKLPVPIPSTNKTETGGTK